MNTRPPNPPPKYPHVYVRADVPDRMGQPFICRCGRAGLAEGERGSGCAAAMRERIAALEEERDAALARVAELEATLANERGEGEPPSEGWARNDIDPKREGVAWYVRWEADGSEPQDDDTEQTRVAWVRRTEGCMIEWMWEIEKSVGRMSDPMLASGRAPTARDAMIAADAARGGR